MTKVHAALDQSAQAHLSEVEAIAAIPAPSFEEHDRAVHVARRFREVGLSDVAIDEVDNVRGFLRGGAPHPHVLLAAHLDTVYPRDAHVPPRRSGSQLLGSSVRDNSPGVAALITLAAALQATGARPAGTLEFVSTSGEEGLGDLRGIRHRLRPQEARPDSVLVVDGRLGQIVHEGIAVRRFAVRFEADGGHSWGEFGRPSAIHHIASLVHTLTHMSVPADPKTTYNVGVIRGGTSVNAIASFAEIQVDFRSVDPRWVDTLSTHLDELVNAEAQQGVRPSITRIGDRPGGRIGADHPLPAAVQETHRAHGIDTHFAAGSTDANIPLALGIPCVSMGVSRGGRTHSPGEWLDTTSLLPGLHLLADVVRAVMRASAPSG